MPKLFNVILQGEDWEWAFKQNFCVIIFPRESLRTSALEEAWKEHGDYTWEWRRKKRVQWLHGSQSKA